VNIEQIIAILLDEGRLGGFHLNNRKYADDDLMSGSINPLELFLIYNELVDAEQEKLDTRIIYMLDQSHNIEPSLEGIIQSVLNTQKAYAKALLVDRKSLHGAQEAADVILANRTVMEAFEQDVNPLLAQVRVEMGRDPDPLAAYRRSGYARAIAAKRKGKGSDTLGGG
jgi:L-rhamnose isomerase/sugar isomerase